MASSGFMADFSKRPLGVKLGVLAVIILALGAAYYSLYFKKLRQDLKDSEAYAEELVTRETGLQKDEAEYKRLADEQKKLDKMIGENEDALPTAAQLDSFFDMINRKVGEAQVDVLRWDRIKEIQIEESIYKVPVEISLQGTFYEIKKFFHLLYKMNQKEGEGAAPATEPGKEPGKEPAKDSLVVKERDRILTIEDLRIEDPVMRNNELVLTVTFRASTFRKEAPEPSEDAKKKDEKAKSTAARKPVTQQVKDDTEDAMKKSEDRAKEATEEPATGTGADKVKGGM